MTVGYQDLLDAADAEVRSFSLEEAKVAHGCDDVVFIDVRDPRELERDGAIRGAKHAPRGMLEFWIDPASPYHKPYFAERKVFLFYCASGWRSLLAAQTAQRMGLTCASLRGGFGAWKKNGGALEEMGHQV